MISLAVLKSLRHEGSPRRTCLGKDEPSSKPTRREEARRTIEEYANNLPEIIRKLRKELN
jgi:hypothetical protein